MDVALSHVHEWIKAKVDMNLLDYLKGTNIFPSTSDGSAYTKVILIALDKVMKLTTHDEISAFLNKRIQVGQSSLYVVSYLEQGSESLHDTVLSKPCNALFSGLSENNTLSSSSR